MAVSTYLSIITLNVNGPNAPIKRHSMIDWIKETSIYNMLPTRDPLQGKRHTHTESEGMGKFNANENKKKAEVAILIDKIDFKTKAIKEDKEGH